MFSRTITRRSTLGTTARDTNTMTLLLHPHPIRPPAPLLQVPTRSPSTQRRVRKSCPLYASGSPCFASLTAPICITCASFMRYLQNFPCETIPSDRGYHARVGLLLCSGPRGEGPLSTICGHSAIIYCVTFSLFFIFIFLVVFASHTSNVCHITPFVCVLSWILWDNAIKVNSCLPDFSVHLRALWLTAFLNVTGGPGGASDMFSNSVMRTRGAYQPDR